MKFRHVCGVALAAVTLGAFGCSQNPPAQQPTTTGATAPYDNSGNTGNVSTGNNNAVDQNGTPQGNMNNTTPNGSMQPQGQLDQNPAPQGNVGGSFTSDGQIVGFVDAVNKAEIEQAHVALQKAKDPQVKAYAQMMINQHGQAQQNMHRSLSSITPETTPQVSQLESDAQSKLSNLQQKTGSDFDRAYIDLQIQEHQQVLNTLDNQLLSAAHDSQLKQQLTGLRPELQHHLERAQAIQSHLGGGSTNP
ncbi:MAG TPA: DUF4142 domain-containing protein [Polyangiaceae bacterium]|jgi:putative membrane protein